jgi:hypothetical protein
MLEATSFSTLLYFALYFALVAWVSWLPMIVTKRYEPPYFWRWTMLVTGSGPLLSVLTLIGFALVAPSSGSGFESFMLTGLFVMLLIIPFQLLVPMTVYLFICSSLKERRQALLEGNGTGQP